MNMQAIMQQAKKMQTEIAKIQDEIDNKDFTSKTGFVTLIMKGTKKISSISFDTEDTLDKEDVELMQDMIIACCNDCYKQIETYSDEKLGKYKNIAGGMF